MARDAEPANNARSTEKWSPRLRSMKVEDVDFNVRRIRVKGKMGTRYVHFVRAIATTLRNYIGIRQTGYLFIDGKPPQQLRPKQDHGTAWNCTWREYDASGKGSRVVRRYVGTAAKLSYEGALAHFAKMANLPALYRPRGLKPLGPDALTLTVQKIGLRVGMRVHPGILRHTFATHLIDHGADINIIKELLGTLKGSKNFEIAWMESRRSTFTTALECEKMR